MKQTLYKKALMSIDFSMRYKNIRYLYKIKVLRSQVSENLTFKYTSKSSMYF